ncbi:hypothetical protein KUCAC02_007311 [Chaenocephalus aceratus]|uniref:Uncharacterized protein n=1 Tax=Chaenocephalus aceratus TaxID=36190 RepID=A0ACB9X6Z8_CHAAC|nr:hypothetical protein KUCAC02_007311 [Chaenocephalus aceratus]
MCRRRVGFWEGHTATEMQPHPLQRVPVFHIPEGTLLFSFNGTPKQLAHLSMADVIGSRSKALKLDTFPEAPPHDLPCVSDAESIPADGGLHFDLP